MFIHVRLPEDDSLLINTDSIKTVNSIKVRDSRMLHGIQIEFIAKKEQDFIIQFKTEAARDEALREITKAIKPSVSFEAEIVELASKGFAAD